MLRFVPAFLLQRTKCKRLLSIFHARQDVNSTEGISKSNVRNTRMQRTNRPNLGAEQKPPTRKVGVEYNTLKVNGWARRAGNIHTERRDTCFPLFFS
jgi:hypothetical protein